MAKERKEARPPQGEPPVNILLVDDRPENLLAWEAVLDGMGHRLLKASSGEDALKGLLREEMGLILLDVEMPGIDGFETAALIRANAKYQHIPIIFISAVHLSDPYVLHPNPRRQKNEG